MFLLIRMCSLAIRCFLCYPKYNKLDCLIKNIVIILGTFADAIYPPSRGLKLELIDGETDPHRDAIYPPHGD